MNFCVVWSDLEWFCLKSWIGILGWVVLLNPKIEITNLGFQFMVSILETWNMILCLISLVFGFINDSNVDKIVRVNLFWPSGCCVIWDCVCISRGRDWYVFVSLIVCFGVNQIFIMCWFLFGWSHVFFSAECRVSHACLETRSNVESNLSMKLFCVF